MSSRLANIDALRGIAALWVFAYHLWNVFAPGYSPQGSPADHKPFTADTPVAVVATYPLCAYGYTGVGLFFVLSGFCIHLPQARRFHRSGSDDLQPRPFFRRRFWRLYPAFFASLFLGAAGVLVMGMPVVQTVIYGVVNAFLLLAVRPDALMLGPVYWTLWYEVQFYLAYPLLLKLCRRLGFGGVAAGLLVIELLFTFVPTPELLQPFAKHFEWLFLRRYFEWFLGMWLAERVAQGLHLPRWGSLGILLAAGAGGVLASHVSELWAGHELLLAVASAGAVSLLVSPASEPKLGTVTAAGRGGLAWCGDWSYSLYLIHMPMLRVINWAVCQLPDEVRASWGEPLLGVSAAVIVPATACVWYHLFEKPFMPKPTATPASTRPSQPALTDTPLPVGERSAGEVSNRPDPVTSPCRG